MKRLNLFLIGVALSLSIAVPSFGGFSIGLDLSLVKSISNVVAEAVADTVDIALEFFVNLVAAVPDDSSADATRIGSSVTYAKVYNSTTGLTIQQIPNTAAAVEGLRWTGSAFVNDDGSGNPLTPVITVSQGGDTYEVPQVIDGWPGASQAVTANAYVVGYNSPHFYYYQADSDGGTTGGTEPAWPTSGTIADNDITWTFQGRYNNKGAGHLTHIVNEAAATNYLYNSAIPQNQTTGSLAADTYTLWVDGTGSASVTDNTATSDAAGQSATEGSPVVFTVSSAGTVDIAVTGSLDRFQLEDSNRPTTFIQTASATATRSATYYYILYSIPENGFQIRGVASPAQTTEAEYFFDLRASPFDELWLCFNAAKLEANIFADSVYNTVTVGTVSANETYAWGISLNTSGVLNISLDGTAGTPVTIEDTRATGTVVYLGVSVASAADTNGPARQATFQYYTGTDSNWYKDTAWRE